MISFPDVLTQRSHQQLHSKVIKQHSQCSSSYLFIILHPLSRYTFTITTGVATVYHHSRMLFIYPLINLCCKKTTENRYSTNLTYPELKYNIT